MKSPASRTIAITTGDPGGIGPEIVDRALASGRLSRGWEYRVLRAADSRSRPGRSTVAGARAAWAALEKAAAGWKKGEWAAVVTGPVQKETLARAGFPFPGQTEFFADRCGFGAGDAMMAMHDRRLTVVLCSTHCRLLEAIRSLTPEAVIRAAAQVHGFLRRIGRRDPRIAVAGVNPHAGEGGLFGDEETRVIGPALLTLQRQGINATGPHAPDTIFHQAAAGHFDAVVCAYHDQGLIPFKLLAFSTGVNVTLGLPIIRTSPDHGTALDIAGTGQADPRSMIAAIRLACRLASKNGWPAQFLVNSSRPGSLLNECDER
jgi:4-hydroxythreonine-4-phosphate dehydrogenase